MPIPLTYPGVYIEEVPSGVRTIKGVSTSVTAFIGSAKRGPINKAVHILNYSDFERIFGGLADDSEMSYAVRQFFLNGGSNAWVVRLAKNAIAASKTLKNGDEKDVLTLTALDEGNCGNYIEVRVDHKTSNPESYFNMSFHYISPYDPNDTLKEEFKNLSMNSKDPRFVKEVINGSSSLVEVSCVPNICDGLGAGKSISGELVDSKGSLLDVAKLIDDTHNILQISVNGGEPVNVILEGSVISSLEDLRKAIQTGMNDKVTVEVEGNKVKITSEKPGENSSVRVIPVIKNDASARLKLGISNGGTEIDAVASIRPKEIPSLHGSLTSGEIPLDANSRVDLSENQKSFKIGLDGNIPKKVTLELGNPKSEKPLKVPLNNIAEHIQNKVQELNPSLQAYKEFTISVVDNKKLRLISGSRGEGSCVVVDKEGDDDFAEVLKLVKSAGATSETPSNEMLGNGNEVPYKDEEVYEIFINSRSERKGIYALEGVDLFNLLCLPGIIHTGILEDASAYCKERRAFLIVDGPKNQKPNQVEETHIPRMPKTDYAAVYYPWIEISDPLKKGKLRKTAPSGTIAGVYARTDSARGIWKAPAGTDANLMGAQGIEYILTDSENGILNPLGVNCIRNLPPYGIISWGARTLRGADEMASEYKYIPIRRLALYIEESLYRGTHWVVFEPNDEPLWSQIRLNAGSFMHNLFRQGAFQGSTPKEAYFVKCDSETTRQAHINLGIVNILVGFAPLKPAEFVIIKIQQIAGQTQS